MIIADSSVWINYFNGVSTFETDFFESLLGQREIGIGDVIVAEVLQGFRSQKNFKIAQKLLLKFPVFKMIELHNAIKSSANYRFLRSNGITIIKTIDCLIATYCIETKMELLHSNKDFIPFEKYLHLKSIHSISFQI